MKIMFRVEYLQSKSLFVHRVTTIHDSKLNINYDDFDKLMLISIILIILM